jgi:hypothetical protein
LATYNLRRFSNPDSLKTIAPRHLVRLLSAFTEFLSGRGFELPKLNDANTLDYEQLAAVLINPGVDTPKRMIDALYVIHEMATKEGMDTLLDAAHDQQLKLDITGNPTPADVAVLVFLEDPELLERKHAEQYLTRPRSFQYFQSEVTLSEPKKSTDRRLKQLEHDLDNTFETKKRGRGTRVFPYRKEDGVWFLVRHGEPYKREGSLEDEKPASVFYRPEKYDVVVYSATIGELRINANAMWEKDLYRRAFGHYLFDDPDVFSGEGKYTLEPLRTDGKTALVCTDVAGMESVTLQEVASFWGGAYNEIETRKADDIFSALATRNRDLPASARLIRASFRVKFSDSKNPRTVTIRPSNIAQYTRDSDGHLVEAWLMKRGFIRKG